MSKSKKGDTGFIDRFLSSAKGIISEGSTIAVGDFTKFIEKFPTGSLGLNVALKGGYPKGKMIEVYGEEQSGKTTLAIEGAKEFQQSYPNEHILWIDLEDVFDESYMKSVGLDVSKNFILAQPNTGEEAWDLMIEFCKESEGGLIVLDSISLLLPEKEDVGSVGDANMALAARMNSLGLRKIFPHMRKSKVTIFAINQLRSKIGVMFGDPRTTTGGNGWKFYARTRIMAASQKGEVGISSNHTFRLDKATYGTEKVVVKNTIIYGEGLDKMGEIVDIASEMEVINKSGSWFSYNDTKLGQGKNAVVELLKDNPELYQEIKDKVMKNIQEQE